MGIRTVNNIRVNRNVSVSADLENSPLVQRYLELNGKVPQLNNVVIKKGAGAKKINTGQKTVELNPVVTGTVGLKAAPTTGNPIFDSDPTVYAEACRQLDLMKQQVGRNNLLHVLRNVIDAAGKGIVLKPDTRNSWMDGYRNPAAEAQQLLIDLDQLGYLDIVVKRRKYHDYKPNQKVFDTWNSMLLYGALSTQSRGYNSGRQEYYLVPFDAGIYLDQVDSKKPEDLGNVLPSWHLIPYRDSYIGVLGDHRGVDLLDLRDMDLSESDLNSVQHKQLFRYIGSPRMAELLTDFHKYYKRGDLVYPRYKMNQTIIFRGKKGKHYQVPEQFLNYLYNNYYGEDLDIEVIEAPGSPAPHLTGSGNSYSAGYRNNNLNVGDYVLAARRKNESKPLILYRFNQIDTHLATIK